MVDLTAARHVRGWPFRNKTVRSQPLTLGILQRQTWFTLDTRGYKTPTFSCLKGQISEKSCMDRFGVIAVTFERFDKWMCAEEKLKECLSVFYFSNLGKKVGNLEYWFLRGSLRNRSNG